MNQKLSITSIFIAAFAFPTGTAQFTVKIPNFLRRRVGRELKFTVDQKGWIAPNAFESKILLDRYKYCRSRKSFGNA